PLGSLSEPELADYVDAFAQLAKVTDDGEIFAFVNAASHGHPLVASYVLSICVELKLAGKEVTVADGEAAIENPAGPVVMLNRRIRDELSPNERQLLDFSTNRQPLTPSQRKTLQQLNVYGLVPPGLLS